MDSLPLGALICEVLDVATPPVVVKSRPEERGKSKRGLRSGSWREHFGTLKGCIGWATSVEGD